MRVPLAVRVLSPVATRVWFTPPPLSSRAKARDSETLAGATPIMLATSAGDRRGFQVGEGPLVLALHGWGGRAAQMVPIARRLGDEGYRVVSVELPGRAGTSPTDLKLIAAAIEALIEETGQPAALVTHSFASLALGLAIGGETSPPVAMVAPLLDVNDALAVFAARAQLFPWTRAGLEKRLQAWDPEVFEKISELDPDQFGDAEVLIVHDPEDGDTAFASSARLAALRPRTAIVPVEDAGHNRILDNPRTLDEVAGFLGRTVPAGGRHEVGAYQSP